MSPTTSSRAESINILVFASQLGLGYLAAPIANVDFVHAALCKHLHASNTLANLPSAIYLGMSWFPVAAFGLFPQARLFQALMQVSFGAMAIICAGVAALLVLDSSASWILSAILLHAAVMGGANGVIWALRWEALQRGVSAQRRGWALGLAYGWGPALAVAGSLAAQFLLEGKLFAWRPGPSRLLSYPNNYAALFAISAAAMGIASYLVRFYRIPPPKADLERPPLRDGIMGGIRAIFRHRVLFLSCLAYLLLYFGFMVQNNMSLFTVKAVGRPSEDLAGYQLALRFGFKMMAGFLLGWLLSRTNAKVPLLATGALSLLGLLWILFVPGYWFLVAFGLSGAGELFGLYYVNYPACCCPRSQVRRNMAALSLLSTVVALSPVFFGWIADSRGLRASIWVGLGIVALATSLAAALPRNPRPRPEDLGAADLADAV